MAKRIYRAGQHGKENFKDGDLLEIDHVLSTAMGGKDTLGNKMVYHRHCHDVKTAEDLIHKREFKAAKVSITNDHTCLLKELYLATNGSYRTSYL